MNVPKSRSKPLLFALIGLVIVGIPLTLFALQHQQIFQQFAWSTQQSAVSQCSSSGGSAVIIVTFANTESSQDLIVTANDLQTGNFVNLGTVHHQEVKSANIVTGKSSLASGSVLFKLTSVSDPTQSTQLAASYFAINNCPVTTPISFCPVGGQNNQGICRWEPLAGAQGYTVVVTQTDTGTVVQSLSVPQDASESAFPMVQGKPYQCTVTPTNVCGNGEQTTSDTKICSAPPPSITPTPPVCLNGTPSLGICRWDTLNGASSYNISVTDLTSGQTVSSGTVQAPTTEFSFPDNITDTYQCTVTAGNICGQSNATTSQPSTCTVPTPTISVTPFPSPSSTPIPTVLPTLTPTPLPTATPTPTPTPLPTATPTPLPTATPTPNPTPTPVVIVRILTQPPPPQTIVQSSQTQSVQQPVKQIVQSQPKPFTPVTPVPTVMPTGNTTPTYLLAGASTILLLAGSLIFFLL